MFPLMIFIGALSITSCREISENNDLAEDGRTNILNHKIADSVQGKIPAELDPDPPIKDTQDWKNGPR